MHMTNLMVQTITMTSKITEWLWRQGENTVSMLR